MRTLRSLIGVLLLCGVAAPAPAGGGALGPAPASAPSSEGGDRLFRDRVEVRLIPVSLRVVSPDGSPVLGLGPEDFEVEAGGRRVEIQAVDWVSSLPESKGPDPDVVAREGSSPAEPAPGKLLVLFFQADLHPSRIKGQVRMRPQIGKLLATLAPEDRAAVLSFDSHLELREDFSRDPERLEAACRLAILRDPEPPMRPGSEPSLARHLDADAVRRAATPEQALRVVAEALRPFPGEKVLVYIGWGLGSFGTDGVRLGVDYSRAKAALAAARVTVFVLDITEADHHSLEVGLERIARETGGTYEKTFLFPEVATERLAQTIRGHYLLYLKRPPDLSGRRRLEIHLTTRDGAIYTRTSSIE